jgi:hypothetical protein
MKRREREGGREKEEDDELWTKILIGKEICDNEACRMKESVREERVI